MNFAEQLNEHKLRLGMTQQQFAAFLGVSPRAVFQWLHGDREPTGIAQEGAIARCKAKQP